MLEEKLIFMRREFHKYPEIGGSLPKTKDFVCRALDEIGISYKLNTGDDGLIAEIKGGNGKKP